MATAPEWQVLAAIVGLALVMLAGFALIFWAIDD
jgi:hypothetical protein